MQAITQIYSTLEQKITLSAQLNGLSASSKGKITFTINLGSRTLTVSGDVVTGGYVTIPDVSLPAYTPVGSYPISASYSDLAGFTGSSTLEITPAATTIEITSLSATGTNYGVTCTLTLKAQVRAANSAATGIVNEGTVIFYINGRSDISIPAATVNSSGEVSPPVVFQLPQLDAKTYVVSAEYKGTGNFSAATTSATSSKSFEVKQADLIITANPQSRRYGAPNPELTYVVSGFVNGDTVATALTGALATDASTTTDVSRSPRPIITIGTLNAINYVFVDKDNKKLAAGDKLSELTITAIPISIKINNQSCEYGSGAFSSKYYTVNEADTGLPLDPKVALTDTSVLTTTAPENTPTKYPVGTYDISGPLTPKTSNYTIASVSPGKLTITKAPLNIKADDQPLYLYGQPVLNSALTFIVVDPNQLKNGEKKDTALTGELATDATATSSVGARYTITQGTLTAANYEISFTSGKLTINKAKLSVIATVPSRVYGNPNSQVILTYTGFSNNETASVIDRAPTITLTPTATTPPGSYQILLGNDGSDNNYEIQVAPTQGSLVITKALLTVTAINQTRTYGEAILPLFISYSYSVFMNSETPSVLTTQPQASVGTPEPSLPGSYPITVSGGVDSNYDFNYVNGTLTINNGKPTLTSVDPSPVFIGEGDTVITLTGTDFTNNSSVTWDKNACPFGYAFISDSEIQVKIPASSLSVTAGNTGVFMLRVSNPGPGGGTSASKSLRIIYPTPVITALNPSSSVPQVGLGETQIVITGTGFVDNASVVQWGGTPLNNITVNSATQITVKVPNAYLETPTPNPVTVQVSNPTDSGGGGSSGITFTINDNPTPVITSLTPPSIPATGGGGGSTPIIITGTGFVTGSTVEWDGILLSSANVDVNSITQITIRVRNNRLDTPGTAQVVVINPGPGGGSSTPPFIFTIN